MARRDEAGRGGGRRAESGERRTEGGGGKTRGVVRGEERREEAEGVCRGQREKDHQGRCRLRRWPLTQTDQRD
jgi:hypothetical protein